MSSRPGNRDTMEGFLRDLSVRLTRLERRSYPRAGGGSPRVWVGDSPPSDGNVELWFSPSATLLYVRVAGEWVPVGGPGGTDALFRFPTTYDGLVAAAAP